MTSTALLDSDEDSHETGDLWDEIESLPLSDTIMNDLEAVLDEDAHPEPEDFRGLANRLHSALRAMLRIGRPSRSMEPLTINLLLEPLPQCELKALGYLRRLATAVLDLADEYIASVPSVSSADSHRGGP
ncbi:hypothetical protein OG552_29575 [Streptomyces sp. NBC_01476]|uniref:hypothetical protein n=1 Tax=Streptomyces sp. NBC_01476 TaxID=2903881 RepID=UPI002E3728FF|nr:hypothetical protein [Streptomyces sp. NBC_01476]